MRLISIVALSIMLASAPTLIQGAENPQTDKAFKEAHLNNLKPYGPGVNEEQRPIWKRLISIAAQHKDYEIAKKIFEISTKADGIMATQYGLDLFELYKLNPLFFVNSVDRYYKSDFRKFLAIWINEAGDVTHEQLVSHAKKASSNKLVKRFLETAGIMEQAMFSSM